jgi:hypothetical protein
MATKTSKKLPGKRRKHNEAFKVDQSSQYTAANSPTLTLLTRLPT